MPDPKEDWTRWLTERERENLEALRLMLGVSMRQYIVGQDALTEFARTIAALRALVEALREAYQIQLDCSNCRGQGCMACVVREHHEECQNDCPSCGENDIAAALALTEASMR